MFVYISWGSSMFVYIFTWDRGCSMCLFTFFIWKRDCVLLQQAINQWRTQKAAKSVEENNYKRKQLHFYWITSPARNDNCFLIVLLPSRSATGCHKILLVLRKSTSYLFYWIFSTLLICRFDLFFHPKVL